MKDLIEALENCLAINKVEDARLLFDTNKTDETVTSSEVIAEWVLRLPTRLDFGGMERRYNDFVSVLPKHIYRNGHSSWSCCDEHMAANYAHTLLRAVAGAYGVMSEGQPLSVQWWLDFNKGA